MPVRTARSWSASCWRNPQYNWGFNAATGEYQDLVGAGVVDPAKVVRTALQDAASVASLLITTEALVAEKPKKETPALPAPAWEGWTTDANEARLSQPASLSS